VLSTFTVNSVGDSPTGIGSNDSGDLRYCINQANALWGQSDPMAPHGSLTPWLPGPHGSTGW